MGPTRLKFQVARVVIGTAGALIIVALGLLAPLVPQRAKPVDQRISGVTGCTASSDRTVIVPAGAKVAYSCPTHIEVVSMDERTPTVLTIRRAAP
jgi:hypothetical protein